MLLKYEFKQVTQEKVNKDSQTNMIILRNGKLIKSSSVSSNLPIPKLDKFNRNFFSTFFLFMFLFLTFALLIVY